MSLVTLTARAGANVPIPVKALESQETDQQLDPRVVSLDSDPSQRGLNSPECRGQDGDRGLDSQMFSCKFKGFLE